MQGNTLRLSGLRSAPSQHRRRHLSQHVFQAHKDSDLPWSSTSTLSTWAPLPPVTTYREVKVFLRGIQLSGSILFLHYIWWGLFSAADEHVVLEDSVGRRSRWEKLSEHVWNAADSAEQKWSGSILETEIQMSIFGETSHQLLWPLTCPLTAVLVFTHLTWWQKHVPWTPCWMKPSNQRFVWSESGSCDWFLFHSTFMLVSVWDSFWIF